jgi:hypothetical protein
MLVAAADFGGSPGVLATLHADRSPREVPELGEATMSDARRPAFSGSRTRPARKTFAEA